MGLKSILEKIFRDKEDFDKTDVRCPFYDTSLILPMMWSYDILYSPMIPFDPDSIQCAMMIESYGPCFMLGMEGGSPNWDLCPRNHWNKGI